MARPKMTMYVDIVSPFAWLAFAFVQRSPKWKAVDITFVPVFLGGIMKATNNRPPIVIKNKGRWINAERIRLAERLGIEVADKAPEGFPNNTITIQRALVVLARDHPDKLAPAIEALFRRFWVERQRIEQKEVYTPVFERVLGAKTAAAVLEKTSEQEIKDTLLKNTAEAVDKGAFGLPFFIVTNAQGETRDYWGADHIEIAMEFLGLKEQSRL